MFFTKCVNIWYCLCVPRFLFILLGPKGKAKSYHEIGRAIATLMSDEVHVKSNLSRELFQSCFILLRSFLFAYELLHSVTELVL